MTAYWICQCLGWGLYCVAGATMAASQVGWLPSLIIGYGLFFLYSIGFTHALRWLIQRREWMTLPLRRSVPRLLLAALVSAFIQSSLVVLIGLALSPGATQYFTGIAALSVWFSVTGATLLWITIYTAIHALRGYNEARYSALQLELALREAELRALEAQVNPHFLFNCLNTIRGMIVEDGDRARDMVTELSNILRYNLQRDRQRTVLLRDELSVVRDYLSLESSRFEERLRVRVEISEAAQSASVPPMLLQILVENALKHGIARTPQGGEVVIRADVHGDQLELEVENTGRLQLTSTSDSPHVGLKNARERLQILYGSAARLDLQSRGEDRVAATVLLPRFV